MRRSVGPHQNTNTQYNHPAFAKKKFSKYNGGGVAERFKNPSVRSSVQADLAMIDAFNKLIKQLDWQIEKLARQHGYLSLSLFRSIPGVGQVLALVIIYEIHDIRCFKSVQDFCSYARLIRPEKKSDGKWAGAGNKKIGNAHLKWAIKEAAMLSIRECEKVKEFVHRLTSKHNKGKAMGIYTHKLGRAIYYMLKYKKAFDMELFFNAWIWAARCQLGV